MGSMSLLDRYQRPITYLRVSVTDRCNLRCVYCMPADGIPLRPREEILHYEEIEHVVKSGETIEDYKDDTPFPADYYSAGHKIAPCMSSSPMSRIQISPTSSRPIYRTRIDGTKAFKGEKNEMHRL